MRQRAIDFSTMLLHTIPFSLAMVVFILVSGLLGRASNRATSATLVTHYGYSLAQMRAGRLWVIVTMLPPWADWTAHVPAIVDFVLVLGFCEWLIGPRRTWLIYIVGHVLTLVLVTIVLLFAFVWCRPAICGLPLRQIDTGTSLGVICCLGAASRCTRHHR